MYSITKDDKAIRTVKVYFGKEFNMDSDNEVFITFREIPTLPFMELAQIQQKLQKKESDGIEERVELFRFFHGHFSEIYVDSNIMVSETQKASPEEIRDIVFGSLRITLKMITEFSDAGLLNP